jgi:hypothetical protein
VVPPVQFLLSYNFTKQLGLMLKFGVQQLFISLYNVEILLFCQLSFLAYNCLYYVVMYVSSTKCKSLGNQRLYYLAIFHHFAKKKEKSSATHTKEF